MTLRIARLSDMAAVTALLERSYPRLLAESYDEAVLAAALPAMTRANPTLLASGTYYVMEGAGILVGCGGWTEGQPGSGEMAAGLAHLRHFATDPDHTSRGIGRAIFDRCVLDAAGHGISRFQAFAGLNAEPFYLRLGLKRLRMIEIPIGPVRTFPTLLMEGPVAQKQG